MKRKLAVLMVLTMLIGILTCCGENKKEDAVESERVSESSSRDEVKEMNPSNEEKEHSRREKRP